MFLLKLFFYTPPLMTSLSNLFLLFCSFVHILSLSFFFLYFENKIVGFPCDLLLFCWNFWLSFCFAMNSELAHRPPKMLAMLSFLVVWWCVVGNCWLSLCFIVILQKTLQPKTRKHKKTQCFPTFFPSFSPLPPPLSPAFQSSPPAPTSFPSVPPALLFLLFSSSVLLLRLLSSSSVLFLFLLCSSSLPLLNIEKESTLHLVLCLRGGSMQLFVMPLMVKIITLDVEFFYSFERVMQTL